MTQLCSSSSPIAALQLSFNSLQAWVHRPQAIAKCLISDLYDVQPIYDPVSNHAEGYRDIFLLNQFPCKFVEIVGLVAGVEDKESRLIITIDDGDGETTLPVQYKLPRLGGPAQPSQPSQPSQRGPITASSVFATARERRLKQEALAKAAVEAGVPKRAPVVLYPRRDICVGDVVRVIGKVDEWGRRKHGNIEWIRGVTVEEGSGGSVTVVDPDEAMWHLAKVMQLHETTYCRPFSIPPLAAMPVPVSSSNPDTSFSYSITSDFETQSEMPSELSIIDDQALPDIRKLRSSQLTENTFRRYLLDYMTEEVRSAALQADVAGTAETDKALSKLFPEYKLYAKAKPRPALTSTQSPNIASNTTPRYFRPKAERLALLEPDIPYPSFTIPSLIATPHLSELAEKIVDSEAKKEERRRRKRILNGEAKEKDIALERTATENGGKVEWRLKGEKKRRAIERLFSWGLRISSEEGSLVHVHSESLECFDPHRTPTATGKLRDMTAYIPLPQPLLLPILLRHLEAEQDARARIFFSKSDTRRLNGMTIDELLGRMRGWGEEGRWERLGDHSVEAGVQWGLLKGRIRREGMGYWAVDRDHWIG